MDGTPALMVNDSCPVCPNRKADSQVIAEQEIGFTCVERRATLRRNMEELTIDTNKIPWKMDSRDSRDVVMPLEAWQAVREVVEATTNFVDKNKWTSTLNVECEESWTRLCSAIRHCATQEINN